jgi:hypothetical protein
LKATRRRKRRGPHRLVLRRGIWLILVPCVLMTIVSMFTATPIFTVWLIAILAGVGVTTAITVANEVTGKDIRVSAIGGAALGLVAVIAFSQADLRGSIEASARASGVSTEQLGRLPKSLSLGDATSLAQDPRTGYLAGSIREARTTTVNAHFTQALQAALALAIASLIVSLFIPRRLKRRPLPHNLNPEEAFA